MLFWILYKIKIYFKDNLYISLKVQGFKTHNISEIDSITFDEFRKTDNPDWIISNDLTAKDQEMIVGCEMNIKKTLKKHVQFF